MGRGRGRGRGREGLKRVRLKRVCLREPSPLVKEGEEGDGYGT